MTTMGLVLDRAQADTSADDWDAALAVWPRAHLVQTYGWASLQDGGRWRAHRLVVEVRGTPLPVLVLTIRSGVPGCPPWLWLLKGPACAVDDNEAWRLVVQRLEQLADAEGARAIEIEPNAWAEEAVMIERHLAEFGRWRRKPGREPNHTAVVDLRGGWDTVLARMKPHGRRNVRLAERRGVEVVSLADPAEAAAVFHRLTKETAARHGIHLPSAATYRRVLQHVPSARIHLAKAEGDVVSGVLVAGFAHEVISLWAGSLVLHRNRQPTTRLNAVVMERAIEEGCERFDLWGIAPDDDPSHPWNGVRPFKLSLGARIRATAGAFRCVRSERQ